MAEGGKPEKDNISHERKRIEERWTEEHCQCAKVAKV